jgi:TatD DNase family protein
MAPKLKYIDSHAHLFSDDYKDDLESVVMRAVDAGVKYIIMPATDLRTSRLSVELSEKYSMIYVCVGIHPHESIAAKNEDLEEIEKLCAHPKVVGIGEIGLDYHYDYSPRESQVSIFESQMLMAVRNDLPVVIHTRKSFDDTLKIVRNTVNSNDSWILKGKRGVFHCYSGTADEAALLKKLGFCISFTGSITFSKSESDRVIRENGLDNLLLETDSPYMTPVPMRGKKNEPANIFIISKKIAEILCIDEEEVAGITLKNSEDLFRLDRSGI